MDRLGRTHPLLLLTIVGGAYVGLAQYVIWLNDPVRNGAGFWPSAGVTLAALLVLPRRRWAEVVAAVFVLETLNDALVNSYPLIPSLWWGAANALEPLVAASLLTRMQRQHLSPLPNLARFLAVGVVVGPLVGASVGTIGTWAEYGVDWWSTWTKFLVGDGIGVLVVAPVLLSLRHPHWHRRSWGELVAAATATVAVVAAVLRLDGDFGVIVPYLVIPLVVWAGLRFGTANAAAAGFVLAHAANLAHAWASARCRSRRSAATARRSCSWSSASR